MTRIKVMRCCFTKANLKMNGGNTMNIRKNIDYSEMYEELDLLMEKELSQMELYCGIGKAVCRRTEKGAAVMASEYLNKHYPDAKGFSPRSLRRMRDFYRTYENHSALLSRAMKLGWIQNVVIMEADLTMELREWYMKAAKQFDWSKTELTANIAANAYESIVLTIEVDVCGIALKEEKKSGTKQKVFRMIKWKRNSKSDIFYIFFSCKEMRKFVIRCRGGPLGYDNREHKELTSKC